MQIRKIFTCLLAGALLLACLGLFVGCGGKITYEDADSYTAGPLQTDERITAIEIYWEDGEVLLKNTIAAKLYATEDADIGAAPPKMHHRIENGVLRIYPCASGERVNTEKTLTLLLPYDYANQVESIRITAQGNAPVTVDGTAAGTLIVNADTAPVILKGKLGEVTVTTSSGDLRVETQRAEGLTFTSDKGNASISLKTNGFVAVMQGEGSFTSEYDAHRDGNVYRYGNQSLPMIFDTRGDVVLKDYKEK